MRRRPELGALGLAVLLAAAAPVALASDDECTELRVTKGATGLDLDWTPPVQRHDTYNVRRCALASLRAGSYGTCVATGLVAPAFSEPEPAGSVFYLATADIFGREASLGQAWDGTVFTPRTAPACGMEPTPRAVTLVISLLDATPVCGSDVRFTFPPELASFVTGRPTGLQDGFLGTVVENPPGTVVAAAATAQEPPPNGPGELARVTLQEGECPLPASVYQVFRCDVVVDCVTAELEPKACRITIE